MGVDLIDLFENIGNAVLSSTTVGIVLGALIAGYFGFRQYKRQKVWENINKRYFEDGLEDFIAYLHRLRLTSENNYADALFNLGRVAHVKGDFKEAEIKPERIPSSMPKSFFITLSMFEDDKNLGDACMDIFVDCGFANEFFLFDFPQKLRSIHESTITKEEKVKKVKELSKEIYNVHQKTRRAYDIIKNLEKILFRLRKINIDSYKKLERARKDKAIQEILQSFEGLKRESSENNE